MGLTLIQRSSGQRPPRNPKVALVLAGGAVTGGAFKVGGLRALDECLVGRGVTDFDLYVGISAGAFLATSLASGLTPLDMIGALEGTSKRLTQLRPLDFYRPNLSEFLGRPLNYSIRMAGYLPGLALDLLSVLPQLPRRLAPSSRRLAAEPSYTHAESLLMDLFAEISPKRQFPALGSLVPSGLFDNSALERWLAQNLAAVGRPNRFDEHYRETGKRLFISASNLDTVDGGVQRTANIDVAIEQGADLIICYNPFRPFQNRVDFGSGRASYLADRGMGTVLSQVFRTLLHTRLQMGLRAYLHDHRFRGDIVVIEARETDEQFFDLNPMAFWKRSDGIRHGFDSVRQTLSDHSDVLRPLFESYGLDFRPPDVRPEPARPPAAPEAPEEASVLRLVGTRAN